MTGYESKRDMAQDKITDEQGRPMTYWGGKAQPAQNSNWAWACNECGAQEFTSALSEADLDYLACANCGGNEFHKEALAQPAQEPVAWMYDWLCDGKLITGWIAHSESEIPKSMAFNIRPLYTAPPQPEQEPDYYGLTSDHLWMSITKDHYNKLKPEFRMACYTTPPQRPWVELEGEEIRNLWEEATKQDRSTMAIVTSFARAIAAKLKEKNNGT